jgi:hypothetical protein
MRLLRLTQETLAPDQYRVRLRLEGDGLPQEAAARFRFQMSEQEREDVRWYLEDFLQYPLDPAPAVAARVEARLAEIGEELFRALFQGDDDARDLWATLRAHLNETRVEIITGVAEAATIPWELLRDPKTGVHLALRAHTFVRSQPQTAQKAYWPQLDPDEPIRILLAICRPGGRVQIRRGRSVAGRRGGQHQAPAGGGGHHPVRRRRERGAVDLPAARRRAAAGGQPGGVRGGGGSGWGNGRARRGAVVGASEHAVGQLIRLAAGRGGGPGELVVELRGFGIFDLGFGSG